VGVFQGSISYTKFSVQGDLPDNYVGGFVRRIRNRVFEALTPDDDADRRWGWCSALDPFDLDLDHEKIFFNSYLNLGFRLDRWALPSALLKAQLAAARVALQEKKGRDRLSRQEKEELKIAVVRKLRRQVLPSMKVMDLSWNLQTGAVRFWSRSSRMIEILQDYFSQTFALKLIPHGAYTIARAADLSEKELRRLETLEPAVFHAEVP
jgi:recombination associated protein RdgC